MIKDNKILILQNILIDRKLPKYNKKISNNVNVNVNDGDVNDEELSLPGVFISNNSNDLTSRQIIEYLDYLYSKSSIFDKIGILISKLILNKFNHNRYDNAVKKEISEDNLKSFFESIKNNINIFDKDNINRVLNKYKITLLNAQNNNQDALVEKILDYAKLLKYELILCQSKFNRYLTENEIIKFYNEATLHEKFKTKLKLTYVKNFIKVIPDNITKLKKEADNLEVFDNYAILHYDYNNESTSETKKEKEERLQMEKDPILFGLIEGSNKLYYIGDWIDEYCDLTLDVIIKKYGEKSEHTLDNQTMINNIDKI